MKKRIWFIALVPLIQNVCTSRSNRCPKCRTDYEPKSGTNKASINRTDLEGRIVGGVPATIEQFPSDVKFYNMGAMCGGTILTTWIILTAAHCFEFNKDVPDMYVEAGSRYLYDVNGANYDVGDFYIHQDYNASTFANDIALLHMADQIKLGKKAQRAILATSGEWMKKGEKNFVVSGWGWTKAGNSQYGGKVSDLMTTNLSYVTLDECMEYHQLQMTSDMFCLYGDGNRDTCKGDSGGSVLWKGMVVGVVSHGDKCAQKNKPSVYANVWYFRDWIQLAMIRLRARYCVHLGKEFSDSTTK